MRSVTDSRIPLHLEGNSFEREAEGVVPTGKSGSFQFKTWALVFVFGFALGSIDLSGHLGWLGLEPALKNPAIVSFDLECIAAHLNAGTNSYNDCEVTKHGAHKDAPETSATAKETQKFETAFAPMAGVAPTMPGYSSTRMQATPGRSPKAGVAPTMRGSSATKMQATPGRFPMAGVAPTMSRSSATKMQAVAQQGAGADALDSIWAGQASSASAATASEDALDSAWEGQTSSADADSISMPRKNFGKKAAVAAAATAAAILLVPANPAIAASAAVAGMKALAVADHSKEAIDMFNNIRIPAILCLGAAGALGPPPPTQKDTRAMRRVKRGLILVRFLSVVSQLIAVILSTNAITRLVSHSQSAETMATSVAALLKTDLFIQYWLGVFVHFIAGLFGLIMLACANVAFLLGVGANKYTLRPIACITGAVVFRVISAINRGVVTQEFGHGNFLWLVFRYLWVVTTSAFEYSRICDIVSLALALGAGIFIVKGMRNIGEWTPEEVEEEQEEKKIIAPSTA